MMTPQAHAKLLAFWTAAWAKPIRKPVRDDKPWTDILSVSVKQYEAWQKKHKPDPRIEDIEHFGVEFIGNF